MRIEKYLDGDMEELCHMQQGKILDVLLIMLPEETDIWDI